MYVERYGEGPRSVLALHGWSGDHRTFEPLRPFLPSSVTLYAPDLPGCGLSKPPREWRLQSLVSELAELAWTLPGPLTLVGNCSGAILGLCLARRLRDEGGRQAIERIVLIDPFAYWPWYFRVFASRRIGPRAYWFTFRNPAGRRLINLALSARRKPDTDLTAGFRSCPQEAALAYLRMLGEIREVSEFAELDAPVRILYGERTFRAVRRSLPMFARLWPAVEIRQIPGAGHLPLKEAPLAVAASIFSEP